MADEDFTLIVVPDRHAEVKRFRFRMSWIRRAATVCVVMLMCVVALVVRQQRLVAAAGENPRLRDENLELRAELSEISERMAYVTATLERVERFDQKLRAITQLSDPQRNLAMGPTAALALTTAPGYSTLGPRPELSSRQLRSEVEARSDLVSAKEQSLQQLQDYFEDQKSVLASVPSMWPARGWVTSDFGSRVDPYSNEQVMHAGIDIAGTPGKEIVAPADGIVVFAGWEGAYGNIVVIDHGYGVKTRFGHLSAAKVKAGVKVRRGELIAALGNTGRSTGPHLHYEVRVNGLAHNPRKFIVDDEVIPFAAKSQIP